MSSAAPASDEGRADISGPAAGPVPARAWVLPALGAAAFAALLPFDGAIHRLVYRSIKLPGDVARSLDALQQYGQGVVIVIVMAAIWLLDRARRRRLLDYTLAVAVLLLAVNVIKVAAGRPRPGLHAPLGFTGAFGTFTTRKGEVLSPLPWSGHHSDLLGSIPSSHAAFAFAMSTFLALLYPPIRPLAWTLAVVVGLGRIADGAHHPSDVVLGALLGWGITALVCRKQLGARLVPRTGDAVTISR
jgi:undecaprenyl-diphosphatase